MTFMFDRGQLSKIIELLGSGTIAERLAKVAELKAKLAEADEEDDIDEQYRAAVPTEDGKLECDDGAVVSKGCDGGAYVQTWTWVSDEEAGIEKDEEDEEE